MQVLVTPGVSAVMSVASSQPAVLTRPSVPTSQRTVTGPRYQPPSPPSPLIAGVTPGGAAAAVPASPSHASASAQIPIRGPVKRRYAPPNGASTRPFHPDEVMTRVASAQSIAVVTLDASSAGTATPAPPPGESHSRGWLIGIGIALVIVLGVLTAAVISRGDSGATTTVQPAGVTVQQNTVTVPAPTVSVKTVTAPATTVQVQPTVTVQKAPTTTTP